jgi:diguanylate cyclase (GGDEF)-like protein/PAS domain S-box-containing protein
MSTLDEASNQRPVPERQCMKFGGISDMTMLPTILEQMLSGAAFCQMLYRDGKPDDFVYLYTNAAFHQQTGLGAVCGKRMSELDQGVAESDAKLLAAYGRVAAGAAPERIETYVGALAQWFSVQVLRVKTGYFLALFDVITRSKRDEQALIESEALFRTLIEHNNALILQVDPATGQILDANASACQFYGWSHEALCSMKIEDINQLDPDQIAAERLAALHQQRNYFVFPHRLASGVIKTVEVHSTPVTVEGRAILVSIIHDITDRKQMEDRLKESEAFGQSILNSMISQIAVLDHNGVIVAVNQPWVQFGLENGPEPGTSAPNTGVGVNYLDVCKNSLRNGCEDAAQAVEGIRAVLDAEVRTFSYEYPCHSPTQQRWVRMMVTPLAIEHSGGVVTTHTDITLRVLNAQRIETLVREQKAMLENDLVGIVTLKDRKIIWANPAFEQMLGFTSGELVGMYTRQLFASEAAHLALGATAYPHMNSGHVYRSEIEFLCKGGNHIWADASGSLLHQETGESLWAFVDITNRRHTEERLRQLSIAVEQSPTSVIITDLEACIQYVNDRFVEVTGYSRAEAITQNPKFLKSGLTPEETYAQMWASLTRGLAWHGEFLNRRKNGEHYWEDVQIAPVKSREAIVTHYVAVKTDITERKQMEEQIRQLAFHDTLTNLPNRRLLMDRLTQAMTTSKRHDGFGALMFLDLDNFKSLNDEHGHKAGDLLLVEVARRLRACVRAADTVSRLGGDEFVVLLGDLTKDHDHASNQANKLAEKILVSLSRPYSLLGENEIEGIEHRCSASIGMVLFSKAHQNPENLLKWADVAMYRSKTEGRNRITFMIERRATQRP